MKDGAERFSRLRNTAEMNFSSFLIIPETNQGSPSDYNNVLDLKVI
jgi:hypothetical protein